MAPNFWKKIYGPDLTDLFLIYLLDWDNNIPLKEIERRENKLVRLSAEDISDIIQYLRAMLGSPCYKTFYGRK
jgi:hypothetical protein